MTSHIELTHVRTSWQPLMDSLMTQLFCRLESGIVMSCCQSFLLRVELWHGEGRWPKLVRPELVFADFCVHCLLSVNRTWLSEQNVGAGKVVTCSLK